jgi:hypothetical protein
MDERIDHDLLERYLLGRVTPDERMAVEENLRTDETWRIALMEERRLAAVVRRAGRDEVKARLRARVAPRAPRVPWVRAASLAAMLVTAVGVAVLLRRPSVMDLPSGQPPPIASDMDVEERAAPAVTGDGKSAGHAGAERGAEAGATPASPAQSGSRREQREESTAARPAGESLAEGLEAPPGKEKREKQIESLVKDDRKSEAEAVADALRLNETDDGASGEWVLATVSAATGGGKDLRSNEVRPAAEADSALRKSDRAPAAVGKGVTVAQAATVSQMPVTALPGRQQTLQAAAPAGTMQARIQRRDGETFVTLYPEIPFSAEELRQAQTRMIGDDSIVVEIGRQSVGMKTRGGGR